MPNGLILGEDKTVIAWTVATYRLAPFTLHVERAIGIASSEGVLIGAFFLRNYNGFNIELSYYGRKTVTPGIVRSIARIAVTEFNPARATIITSKKNKRLINSLQKFGWKIEGVQRCYYGAVDCQRNKGVRLVMFRNMIDKIAAFPISQDSRTQNAQYAATGA